MSGFESGSVLISIIIFILAIVFLKGFDRISGRGPKQVKDWILSAKSSSSLEIRISCPHCAEKILPAAKKCPFCRSSH